MNALDVLQNHADLLDITNNALLYLIRPLGWVLLKGIALLVSGVENVVDTLFGNLDFFNSPEVLEFTSSLRPIILALLFVGIIMVGYQLMFNRQKEKSKIPMNILIFVLVLTGLPTMMGQLSGVTSLSIDMLVGDSISITDSLIAQSVTDLKYIDENNFSDQSISDKNVIGSADIENINVAELMTPKECENREVFENTLKLDANGGKELSKLEDVSFFGTRIDLLTPYYYRYNIDWLTLFFALIALLLSFTFSALKIAKIIFEIAYAGIYTTLTAPLDLSTGQRTKRCIQEIISLFMVLISIALMFRLYLMGVAWVTAQFDGLALVFMLLGMSWALIDGPNIVQKLLGIDAGLTSAARTILATYSAVKGAGAVGKGLAEGAKEMGKAAASGIGFAGGYASGIGSMYKKAEKNNPNQEKPEAPYGIYGGRQIEQKEPAKLGTGTDMPVVHENTNQNDSDKNSPNEDVSRNQMAGSAAAGSSVYADRADERTAQNNRTDNAAGIYGNANHADTASGNSQKDQSSPDVNHADAAKQHKDARIGEEKKDTAGGIYSTAPTGDPASGNAGSVQTGQQSDRGQEKIDTSLQVGGDNGGKRHVQDDNTTLQDLSQVRRAELKNSPIVKRLSESYHIGRNTARSNVEHARNFKPMGNFVVPPSKTTEQRTPTVPQNGRKQIPELSSPDVPTKKLFGRNRKKK